MALFKPYPISGSVDTSAVSFDIVAETEYIVKSVLVQNTHATNNLKVYFLGKGEASITLFPKTNISLTAEGPDRLDIRKVYLQGSAAATTWEILCLIGKSAGPELSEVT